MILTLVCTRTYSKAFCTCGRVFPAFIPFKSVLVSTIETIASAVADPDQAFGGAVKLGGAKNVFTCYIIPKVVCDNRCVSHKRDYVL